MLREGAVWCGYPGISGSDEQVASFKKLTPLLKHKEEMIRPEAILIFEESPRLIQKGTFPTTLLQIFPPPSYTVP
jgi:hypothetical protein